jgi:hypothetical protein
MLAVLRFEGMRKGQPFFICLCQCGREVSVRGANLRSRNTKSCGCSRRRSVPRNHGKMVMKRFCDCLVWGKGNPSSKNPRWMVVCRCGLFYFQTEQKIRSGQPLCRCSKRTYTSWQKMIERCTYKKHPQFDDYGGRGITVCQRWRESFCAFLEDMGKRPEGMTIDRYPNSDGNYEPGNCRWATTKQQAENRRPRAKK